MGEPGFQSFKDLIVWQTSMELAANCYSLTKVFPREEQYGMTAQIRRAAASVAANIAEGHGRESTGSFVQFLRVAQGSIKELETHLLLAEKVGLAPSDVVRSPLAECEEIGKMLRALIRTLQRKLRNSTNE